MKVEAQSTEDLLGMLSRLEVDWRDDTAVRAIEAMREFPVKASYTAEDIRELLSGDFQIGTLIVRLFLGTSKDVHEAMMIEVLGKGKAGVTGYRKDPRGYVAALIQLGILDAMRATVHRDIAWYDVLVERLRSGRGSAVSGQKRGRAVEDFVEAIVRRVFGGTFETRCNFQGQRGRTAKCDFAIPERHQPAIVIEAKGYDATGSKMTDVIGDIEKIIVAKRPDTAFMLFTDGISWIQRRSDFVKIVDYQNQGDITRIYTQKMADTFEADLRTLKAQYGL